MLVSSTLSQDVMGLVELHIRAVEISSLLGSFCPPF